MERVSVIQGDLPILLIAPFGADDNNIANLLELMSSEMGTFSVINKGWKKSKYMNFLNEEANCNNIVHIQNDVVKEEFLDPILRTVAKIQKKLDERVYVINIHGCDDKIKNIENLDMIIGYGEGNPPNHTCNLQIKDAFIYFLEKENFNVYEGKSKKYSAASKNNICQLYKWHQSVHSIQLMLAHKLYDDMSVLQITSERIVAALDDLLLFDDATKISSIKRKYI